MAKPCAVCAAAEEIAGYDARQWRLGRWRRCRACAARPPPSAPPPPPYAAEDPLDDDGLLVEDATPGRPEDVLHVTPRAARDTSRRPEPSVSGPGGGASLAARFVRAIRAVRPAESAEDPSVPEATEDAPPLPSDVPPRTSSSTRREAPHAPLPRGHARPRRVVAS